jgi:hypothetical protein
LEHERFVLIFRREGLGGRLLVCTVSGLWVLDSVGALEGPRGRRSNG